MGVYATVNDLAVGDDPPTVIAAADLIEVAEAKIAQRVPNLAARITAGRTSTVLVRNVVVEMVTAVLRNPATPGVRSVARTEGPFSESTTYDTAAAAGRLALTRSQLYDLGQRRGAQTVPVGDPALARVLTPPDDSVLRVFANTAPTDEGDEGLAP